MCEALAKCVAHTGFTLSEGCMRKQRAGSFVIRTVAILLALAIGVMISLALLPRLFSADVSFGPPTSPCSTPYVAIKNTGLLPFTLEEWEVKYEATGYAYSLPKQTLLPGRAIRVWSASGENGADDLYAGRMEREWEVNGLVVHGKSPVYGEISWWQSCD
jgi:hypothetical protein